MGSLANEASVKKTEPRAYRALKVRFACAWASVKKRFATWCSDARNRLGLRVCRRPSEKIGEKIRALKTQRPWAFWAKVA